MDPNARQLAEGIKIDDDTLLTRRQPVGRAAELHSLVHERGDLYVRWRHRGKTMTGAMMLIFLYHQYRRRAPGGTVMARRVYRTRLGIRPHKMHRR